jgi:DNA-binding transcriptional regulator YdaS (Cro superfamily)
MTGFVYAMTLGDLVKIGYSSSPANRRCKVQSDAPGKVVLVGQIAATKKREHELHSLFKPWHHFGEWYRFEGLVASFVATLPPPQQFEPRATKNATRHLAPLLAVRQSDAARACGVNKSTMSRWLSGRERVCAERVIDVERVTGIPREKLRPDLYVQAFNAPPNDTKHVKPAASRDG